MKREPIVNVQEMTVREFGDAADAAGFTPSQLLAESWLRLVASKPAG